MKRITSLQLKENLLKQTIDIEHRDRENVAAEEAEQNEETKQNQLIQEHIDEEVIMQQEEARRNYILDEFNNNAEKQGIPRSFVRLQHEMSGINTYLCLYVCSYLPIFLTRYVPMSVHRNVCAYLPIFKSVRTSGLF